MLKHSVRNKSEVMQKDFINTTEFLFWFIENYPRSVDIIKEKPDFQLRFRGNFPVEFTPTYTYMKDNKPTTSYSTDWDEYRLIVNYTF